MLAVMVLSQAVAGFAELILIFLGIAAILTGLYSLIWKKRSWAGLPGRNAAIAVAIAGVASLVIGGVAAGSRGAFEPETVTSATLEADAAARLKAREDAVATAEAKLAERESAVAARETTVGGAEAAAVANVIREGVWTVGTDIEPGTYRTTKEVLGDCSWAITRTGSNGSDYIDQDFFVEGGFPQVALVEGHTFDTDGCGEWSKQ